MDATGSPDEGLSPARRQKLLTRVIDIYTRRLGEDAEVRSRLAAMGLGDLTLLERHEAGWCAGDLAQTLPSGGKASAIRGELALLGLLDGDGAELLSGRLILPVFDVEGAPLGLAGADLDDGTVRVAPPDLSAAWNIRASVQWSELYVAESPLDGLCAEAAGCPNIIAAAAGLSDADIAVLAGNGVRRLVLLHAGHPSGPASAERLEMLVERAGTGIRVDGARLPAGRRLRESLREDGAEALATVLARLARGEQVNHRGADAGDRR